MRTPRDPIYAGHRYPAEVISYAVWLYFRFPLSLRMVEEMLAARGISVTHETIRQWGLKFGQEFANRIRRRAPRRGDKWHLDEVVISVAGPGITEAGWYPSQPSSHQVVGTWDTFTQTACRLLAIGLEGPYALERRLAL